MKPSMALYVRLKKDEKPDRLGNMLYSYTAPQKIERCMFAPSDAQDTAQERPDGIQMLAVAYLPRGWAHVLRGALISTDGTLWLKVVGQPVEYPQEMLPNGFVYATRVWLGAYDG